MNETALELQLFENLKPELTRTSKYTTSKISLIQNYFPDLGFLHKYNDEYRNLISSK